MNMIERINTVELDIFIEKNDLDRSIRKKLKYIRKNLVNDTFKATYKSSFVDDDSLKTRLHGNGLCLLPKHIRRRIGDGYNEIDIVNCGFVLMSQLLKSKGILCPKLDEYVKNRNKYLKHSCIDRVKAKTMFNRSFNGQFFDKQNEFAHKLAVEMLDSRDKLLEQDEYKYLTSEYTNKKAFYIIQEQIERKVIESTIEWLEEHQFEVGTKMYDSVLVRANISSEIIHAIEEYVFQKTAYRVEYIS